jgi:hypothetical protein
MRLRRADGTVYLDRWGWGGSVAGLFLHRMCGPDPADHLHDHPWTFVSLILWGGYTEERADTRSAPLYAALARRWPGSCTPGAPEERRPLSVRLMRLDEAHRIVSLRRRTSWSVVLHLPRRRKWGFYTPEGYLFWQTYDEEGHRDGLILEISSNPEDQRVAQR